MENHKIIDETDLFKLYREDLAACAEEAQISLSYIGGREKQSRRK